MQHAGLIILTGIGATAVMDLWLQLLQRLGLPTGSFAMIGRWAGHLARGRVMHLSIAKSDPVRHELTLGWAVHYAVGIAFAFLLAAVAGTAWFAQPRLLPALATGIATVAAPLLIMQPAMGQGIAASKTPQPLHSVLRSLANHGVFGLGLYLSACLLA